MSKKHWESYFTSIKEQDWNRALDSLNAILKQEPRNSQVHLKVGDVFQKAGDLGSAVAAYRQSAWIMIEDGFFQKALAIFKIILRLDPDNDEAINKSKDLMLEIESSKIKSGPVIQSLEAGKKPEEKAAPEGAPGFPAAGTECMETEQKAEVEFGSSVETRFEESAEQGVERELTEKMRDMFTGTPVESGDERELGHGLSFPSESGLEEDAGQKTAAPPPSAGEDSFFAGTSLEEDFLEPTAYSEKQEKKEFFEQPAPDESETRPPEEGSVFNIPVFLSSLSEDEIRGLISGLDVQTFSPGYKVLREGDSGDSVYVIKSGKARVIANILGKEIELAILSAGDAFGEVAFLTGRPRTATVIAEDNLSVLEFTRPLLEDVFLKYPETLKKLEDFYQYHLQDTLKKAKIIIKK